MFEQHSNVDNRSLFRFEAMKVVKRMQKTTDGEREVKSLASAGWSLAIYADDKREAIKSFVSMTSPTQRFVVTEVTEDDLGNNVPFVDVLSRVHQRAA